MEPLTNLKRDQLLALMVAEHDAIHRGVGPFEPELCPDEVQRNRPAVDLVGRDQAGTVVAVEHTIVESYDHQIMDIRVAKEMFPFGGPEIDGYVDAGSFRLFIPAGELASIEQSERARAAESIEAWVRDALDESPCPASNSPQECRRGTPTGVSFEVSLIRMAGHFQFHELTAQVVMIEPRPSDGIDRRREERISRSLRNKCPKLLKEAGDGRSILVLEDRDLRYSSPASLVSCLRTVCAGIDLPDLVALLDVTAGNPLVWRIFDDGNWAEISSICPQTFPGHRCGELNRMKR